MSPAKPMPRNRVLGMKPTRGCGDVTLPTGVCVPMG